MDLRKMSDRPLNAETPAEALRSWITANSAFFHRNQSEMKAAISLEEWRLSVDGEVKKAVSLSYNEIISLPKAINAGTLECAGNGRSLLKEKASGNPWTIGGVGNAVWGGIWLKEVLQIAGVKEEARYVTFEGMDAPLSSAGVKFIRSIPLEKALGSTLLAYEMTGEPLPLPHGFPLRALALGWVGASCCKWLHKITVASEPHEGYYRDRVYRIYQKGEDPRTGTVTTVIPIKTIITRPLQGEILVQRRILVLGAAYGGEAEIIEVDVSEDGGQSWSPAEFLGPNEPFAWRHWQYLWNPGRKGEHRLMARATDSKGNRQPMTAVWNVLGYGNNGVEEHSLKIQIV